MKNIKIACKGNTTASITELVPFQGNLKDLSTVNYKKLRGEIIRLGFSEPISIWVHRETKYILNGHQRIRTILKMIAEENFQCPQIPINFVEAKDEKEAKQKVLALTSQYGEITGQGLYEFLSTSDIDYSELENSYRFPEINTTKFIDEYFKDQPVDNPVDNFDKDKKYILIVECDGQDHQKDLYNEFQTRRIKCKTK